MRRYRIELWIGDEEMESFYIFADSPDAAYTAATGEFPPIAVAMPDPTARQYKQGQYGFVRVQSQATTP